jgi:hypothetical protein
MENLLPWTKYLNLKLHYEFGYLLHASLQTAGFLHAEDHYWKNISIGYAACSMVASMQRIKTYMANFCQLGTMHDHGSFRSWTCFISILACFIQIMYFLPSYGRHGCRPATDRF